MVLRVAPENIESVNILSTGSDAVAIATRDAPWFQLADGLQEIPREGQCIKGTDANTGSVRLKSLTKLILGYMYTKFCF